MESWLGPDGGTTETVMEVTDVKVNTGPPGP
jgi:hypothetical protein